ncbi:MAG: adenosylcobinamide-GDP ribazoletransferase [Firmicutes bacterium]|nr:adenosylcobinamide-GDP ribazoletransferase [Bacillota bacterium]
MRSLLLAAGFLTILPVGRNINATESEIGRSLGWFPAVGLALGGASAGAYYLFNTIGLNLLGDVLAVLALVVLTGGLHWDGLMDTADGLLSCRSRERMLEIMKDSNVGAMGVLAALCLLLLKVALVIELAMPDKLYILVLAPVISRLCMVHTIIKFPYARKKGFGGMFAHHAGKSQLALAALTGIGLTVVIWPVGLIFVGIALLFSALLSWHISRKLGGLTGDVYGAITELTEVAVLFMGVLPWTML